MIAWIGVVAALSFFVLWGGGILQDLGRHSSGGPSGGQPAVQPPPSEPSLLAEETRLKVFEAFIRSLPDDAGSGPPPAAP
jgi:hypothetical protein